MRQGGGDAGTGPAERVAQETRDRYFEAVEIIRLALTGEPCFYQGTHYKIPETTIRPRPADASRTHLSGAITSADSAKIMARLKLPLIQALFFPDEKAREVIGLWKTVAETAGLDTSTVDMPFMGMPTVVAKSDDEAREIARKFYPVFARVQAQHYETAKDPWKDLKSFESHSKTFANMARLMETGPHFERFLDLQLVGSPETVIRRLETLQEVCRSTTCCASTPATICAMSRAARP